MSSPKVFGVVIVAFVGKRLIFVRSQRPAVGEELIELPRGFAESRKAAPSGAIEDGLRELREETGFTGEDAEVIGSYFTDTTTLPNLIAVVCCTVKAKRNPEVDGEVDEILLVPREDVPSMLTEGLLRDAHTLSALAIATNRGLINLIQ